MELGYSVWCLLGFGRLYISGSRAGISTIMEGVHPLNDNDTFIHSMLSDLSVDSNLDEPHGKEFSALLNVWDIHRLTNIKFEWTDNLLEHLRVRKDDPKNFRMTIMIFHHATALHRLKE